MPALNPQILGQAEAAHRALLERILESPGLTYVQWVTLSLTAANGRGIGHDELCERLVAALKVPDAVVLAAVGGLEEMKLLAASPADTSRVEFTAAGKRLHREILGAIKETVHGLYSGIPADELATAGRVLSEITARADADRVATTKADLAGEG